MVPKAQHRLQGGCRLTIVWRSCISTQFEVLICCGRSAGGECGVGKRSPDCKFAFATLADIERWRAGISTNSRNMDETLDSNSCA
jgi:hypothetical protein